VEKSDLEFETSSSTNVESWWPLIIACCVVAILWATSAILLWPVRNRGEFGDMFGAVNALFSGLAFAGLIFTMHVQRKELSMQRQELALQRHELAASREVMKEQQGSLASQAQTLQDQRFEGTLFSLLDSHLRAVDSIYYSRHLDVRFTGRAAIEAVVADAFQVAYAYASSLRGDEEDNEKDILAAISRHLSGFYATNSSFFTGLEVMLHFVGDSTHSDKARYLVLLNSQLSLRDHQLLMLIALGEKHRNVRALINKFGLLHRFALPSEWSESEGGSHRQVFQLAEKHFGKDAFVRPSGGMR
jgi:hypothetical protein